MLKTKQSNNKSNFYKKLNFAILKLLYYKKYEQKNILSKK